MCCLKYEQHAYEDAQTRMPKNDSFVQTPDGPGNISAVNLVKERVTVRLDDAPEAPKTYQVGEIIVLRNGKGSRDGIAIPDRPARIADEPVLDPFGMEIAAEKPAMRQFRNSPPPRRERSEEKRDKNDRCGGKGAARDAAAAGSAPQKEAAEQSKQPEANPSGERSHRSHRGGRGRRGGERKDNRPRNENQEKSGSREIKAAASKAETGSQQSPRPVRFGSSMPIAAGAATPEGSKPSHRRGRRPSRRGRGGRGKGENSEKSGT